MFLSLKQGLPDDGYNCIYVQLILGAYTSLVASIGEEQPCKISDLRQ